MLDGGLFSGEVYELAGASGTGKTQLCMAVCAQQAAQAAAHSDLKFALLHDGASQDLQDRLFHAGVASSRVSAGLRRMPTTCTM